MVKAIIRPLVQNSDTVPLTWCFFRLKDKPNGGDATPSFSSLATAATPSFLDGEEEPPQEVDPRVMLTAGSTPATLLTPASRTTSRLNGKAAPGRILKSATTKTDLLRKSALKSCHNRGLIRFTRSSVDLKQQEEPCDTPDIPPGSVKFVRPDSKLVKSISRSCLRSFQEFHTSPEGAAAAAGPQHPPGLNTPARHIKRENSGGEGGKQEESPKGECGARGLTPLSNRARINLLKGEGMVLEKGEAEEIKSIRDSRLNCGCSCKGRTY